MKIEYIYEDWGDIYKKLLSNIPKGNYYDNRSEIVPANEVAYLQITTSNINVIHYMSVTREDGSVFTTTFIPESETYCIKVKFGVGLNSIGVAVSEKDVCTLTVTATYFAVILYSYAKELYESTKKLDSIKRDIYVNEATRLLSPILGFSKQITDNHVLRTFGLQLIVRALVNKPGTMSALEDICKALYLNTPIIEDTKNPEKFNSATLFYAGQEYELGKVVTLWVRNPGLLRRLYGMSLSINSGDYIEQSDDSTLVTQEGYNEYEDEDSPLFIEDINEGGEGILTIDIEVSFSLPRTDRNLPIPFTIKHPWFDKSYTDREHLDTNTSLDIATVDDPTEDGMIGKQYIPYKYDGEKASSINKVIKVDTIIHGKATLSIEQPTNAGVHILTEQQIPIAVEHEDGEDYKLLIVEGTKPLHLILDENTDHLPIVDENEDNLPLLTE